MSRSHLPKKISSNPPAPIEVKFESLDANEDGNITSAEIDLYNKAVSGSSQNNQITTPVYAMIAIGALTAAMCLLARRMKCTKNE